MTKANLLTIKIDDKTYPCRETMGAMLRYKNETGKEASEMQTVSDWCVYLYCCIKSASHADGIDFDFDLETFADKIDAETLTTWINLYVAKMTESQKAASTAKKK